MSIVSTVQSWTRGIRFYLAIGIWLFTLEAWWWAVASYAGTTLFATRLEELYAWTAVMLLAVAVSIGPVCSVWPQLAGKQLLYDARRLLGVGAAWFSILHITIAYSSLFRFANPLSLPTLYEQAFAAGAIAAIVLLAMAFTSFDKAVSGMGKWWFRLHRFVYGAVLLVLLHAFLIGVHATQWPQLIGLTIIVLFTLGLHIYLVLFKRRPLNKGRLALVLVITLLLLLTLAVGFDHRFGPRQSPPKTQHTNASMQGMTEQQMNAMDMH